MLSLHVSRRCVNAPKLYYHLLHKCSITALQSKRFTSMTNSQKRNKFVKYTTSQNQYNWQANG